MSQIYHPSMLSSNTASALVFKPLTAKISHFTSWHRLLPGLPVPAHLVGQPHHYTSFSHSKDTNLFCMPRTLPALGCHRTSAHAVPSGTHSFLHLPINSYISFNYQLKPSFLKETNIPGPSNSGVSVINSYLFLSFYQFII